MLRLRPDSLFEMANATTEADFLYDCARENADFATLVADLLVRLPQHLSWADMRDDPKARRAGYDFVVRGPAPGPAVRVEYKGDHKETGNIAFEIVSQLPYAAQSAIQPGWGITSRAAWLVYDLFGSGFALVVPMPVLREFAFSRLFVSKTTSCINRKRGQYFTYSLLLSVEQILADVVGAKLVRRATEVTRVPFPVEPAALISRTEAFSTMLRFMGGYLPPSWAEGDLAASEGLYVSHGRAGVDSAHYLSESGQARLLALVRQLHQADVSRHKFPELLSKALRNEG